MLIAGEILTLNFNRPLKMVFKIARKDGKEADSYVLELVPRSEFSAGVWLGADATLWVTELS